MQVATHTTISFRSEDHHDACIRLFRLVETPRYAARCIREAQASLQLLWRYSDQLRHTQATAEEVLPSFGLEPSPGSPGPLP